MPKQSLAVLIDAENIASDLFPWLDQQFSGLGDPIVRCLFGDFSANRLGSWLAHAQVYGLQPVLQLNGGKGKNSTDIALAIHAMDLLHSGSVGGICLVSSDRDFAPLALRLRAGGLRVYGFGRTTPGTGLTACCTQFFELPGAVSPACVPARSIDVPPPKPAAPKSVAQKPALMPAARQIYPRDPARIVALLLNLADSKGVDGWIALSFAAAALRAADPEMAGLPRGKGKVLKLLNELEAVDVKGSGTTIQIRVKARPAVA